MAAEEFAPPQRPGTSTIHGQMEVGSMVAVKEFSWEEVSSPDFGTRAAWREAVAAIADKAKAKLPECNGRVDKAVALVLNGDVELLPDGTAKVTSQSNGTTQYVVCNGHCPCKDYERAPHKFCKHRVSAAIARRAQELTRAKLDADTNGHTEPPSQPAQPEASPAVTSALLPEAPVSIVRRIGDVEECYHCNQECWDILYIPTS